MVRLLRARCFLSFLFSPIAGLGLKVSAFTRPTNQHLPLNHEQSANLVGRNS